MGFYKNRSVFVKIFSFFLIVILLAIASHMLVAQRVQKEFLRKQATSISRQIILTRQWVASLGGVWSKNVYSKSHGFLAEYKEPSVSEAAVFYLHNPALATREISSLAHLKHGYDFRVVSDMFREPKNKPDPFESSALQSIKENKVKYYDKFVEGIYRYTEPLFVKQGCLKCHGDLEKDVKEPMKSILLNKYGTRAFGYQVGDVRGIISIRIPTESWISTLTTIFSYSNYIILAVIIVLFYIFTRFAIVAPITKLTEAALQLSKGKMNIDLGVTGTQQKTKNEIIQLAIAFERLRKSFQIVLNKFAKLRKVGSSSADR
ncbi:MAG: DUF3365 domain-containing protein [Deltaproteobacteria bacterium]|nr:DUF3365 domain-containing protein [Deltaproteobacteria bacterium]